MASSDDPVTEAPDTPVVNVPVVDDEPVEVEETELPDPTPPEPTPLDLLNVSIEDFNILADEIGLADLDITPDTNVQISGNADFAGFITVEPGPADILTAAIDLALNFDDGSITAEHGQFFRDDTFSFDGATPYDGELRLQGGRIGRNRTNQLELDVLGTLRNGPDRVRVAARLEGGIVGDNSEALVLVTPLFGGPEDFTVQVNNEEQSGLARVGIVAITSE